jgi:Spy/CpxP family protein refolding chaperone
VSFGIQGTTAGTSSAVSQSGSSLRPFANLDLTEQQRKQIRQIFQTAQSQGTSQSDVQSQINAILTPAQQQQLQTDLQSQTTAASTGQGQSAQGGSHGPLTGLNLTSTQQSQIQQILQTAHSQGTSQSDVQSQINAVLTPAQQQQLQQNLQQLGTGTSSTNSSNQTLPPILASLNLTAAQQTQIQSILSNAQSQGLSLDQVKSEINSILTTSQLQQVQQKVQGAHANSEANSSSSATTSSSSQATLPNGLTVSDIQKQIAAGLSVLLQQIQNEIGTAPSATTSST